jgi:hypothetical protein
MFNTGAVCPDGDADPAAIPFAAMDACRPRDMVAP